MCKTTLFTTIVVFIVFLASCEDSDTPIMPPSMPPVVMQALGAEINSNTRDVLPDTDVELSLSVQGAQDFDATWTTDDGRSFSGQNVVLAFDAPGIYSIDVAVTTQDGRSASDEITLIVNDPNSVAPPELNMPDKLSDVDGDGLVDAKDFLMMGQFTSGARAPTSFEQVLTGDLDLDELIGERDFILLGKAIFDRADLPTTVISERQSIKPLTMITAISPALANPGDTISITIDGHNVEVFSRVIQGYVQLVVPELSCGRDARHSFFI